MTTEKNETVHTSCLATDRIVRLDEVRHLTGLCKAHVYALAREDKFPKPIKLTPDGRSSGWLLSEVQAFIAERVKASRLKK